MENKDWNTEILINICIAWFAIPLALLLWPFIEWQDDERFLTTALAWLFIPVAIGLWPFSRFRLLFDNTRFERQRVSINAEGAVNASIQRARCID